MGVFVHNLSDVIAHHTGGTIMHDAPLHLDTTKSSGEHDNNCSSCGLNCEGFKFTTNKA